MIKKMNLSHLQEVYNLVENKVIKKTKQEIEFHALTEVMNYRSKGEGMISGLGIYNSFKKSGIWNWALKNVWIPLGQQNSTLKKQQTKGRRLKLPSTWEMSQSTPWILKKLWMERDGRRLDQRTLELVMQAFSISTKESDLRCTEAREFNMKSLRVWKYPCSILNLKNKKQRQEGAIKKTQSNLEQKKLKLERILYHNNCYELASYHPFNTNTFLPL